MEKDEVALEIRDGSVYTCLLKSNNVAVRVYADLTIDFPCLVIKFCLTLLIGCRSLWLQQSFSLVIGCVVSVIFHQTTMTKSKCPRAEEGPCGMVMPMYEDVSLHKTTPVILMDENIAYSLQ